MTDQLARPGDFVTATIGEVPIVITRGEDGELRAFANVCRHRGAQVVRECARQPQDAAMPLPRLDV